MRRRELLGLALAAFAASGCDKLLPGSATPFNGVDITGSDLGPDFRLTDHNGKPRTLADFRGKVVALFFGQNLFFNLFDFFFVLFPGDFGFLGFALLLFLFRSGFHFYDRGQRFRGG